MEEEEEADEAEGNEEGNPLTVRFWPLTGGEGSICTVETEIPVSESQRVNGYWADTPLTHSSEAKANTNISCLLIEE